jgi:signal peptidase I
VTAPTHRSTPDNPAPALDPADLLPADANAPLSGAAAAAPPAVRWRRVRRIWRQVRAMAIIVLLLTSFRSAIADWNDVPSGSMEPSILPGDRIFVNKLAYDLKIPYTTWRLATWADPRRGDIVIFFNPVNGARYVKRVIGVPGDMIELRSEVLYVNGQRATYERLPIDDHVAQYIAPDRRNSVILARERAATAPAHPIMVTPWLPSHARSFGPTLVPDAQYFVLGDNRDNSQDSRTWGFVPRSAIVGRASSVLFSVDPDRYYAPRWNRFFDSLP